MVCIILGVVPAILAIIEKIPGNIFFTIIFCDVLLIAYFSRAIKPAPKREQPNLTNDAAIEKVGQIFGKLVIDYS